MKPFYQYFLMTLSRSTIVNKPTLQTIDFPKRIELANSYYNFFGYHFFNLLRSVHTVTSYCNFTGVGNLEREHLVASGKA